jgi:hypothetical protein
VIASARSYLFGGVYTPPKTSAAESNASITEQNEKLTRFEKIDKTGTEWFIIAFWSWGFGAPGSVDHDLKTAGQFNTRVQQVPSFPAMQ